MKDNNKAKLLTVGIAVVLILIVCGISVIIYALNKRNSQDTNTMLQEDIMEYANASQQQSVTAQDIEKQDSIPKETEKSEEAEKKEEPEKQEEKEVTAEEEPAVVVEEQEETQEQSIMEEEAGKQDSEKNGKMAEGSRRGPCGGRDRLIQTDVGNERVLGSRKYGSGGRSCLSAKIPGGF